MIREELINKFITKYVFPDFREVEHPILSDRFFAIGPNDTDRVACIHSFDEPSLYSLYISPFGWVSLQGMFSLSEEETVIILTDWFNKNVPLLSFNDVILLNYP